MSKLIDALVVKPMEIPCITQLCTDSKYLDAAVSVGANVECSATVLELSNGIGILYAWDAPALGLLGNRKIGKRIIPGVFYVVRYKNGELFSLTPKDIAKYTYKFQVPQIFTHDEMVASWFDGLFCAL